jgi:hypothetical protein
MTSSLVRKRTESEARSRANDSASGTCALWAYFDELRRCAIAERECLAIAFIDAHHPYALSSYVHCQLTALLAPTQESD